MRAAGSRRSGTIDSAVMLNAQLALGKPLLDMLRLTKSLGRKVAEDPETFVWTDSGGASVRVLLKDGRVASWQLERPDDQRAPAHDGRCMRCRRCERRAIAGARRRPQP